MTKKQKSAGRSKSGAKIGAHDWRQGAYDTFTYDSPFLRRWIAEQLPAKKTTILSIGCGSGELEDHLTELGHGIIGLDLSHQMLKRAATRGLDLLVEADARSLPFGAAQFDHVMLVESIGYLEPDAVLCEARRVLRKRGRLLITTYGPRVDADARYRKWRMEEITDRLVVAGFRIGEQRYLDVKKNSLQDVPSEDRSTLLYISSTVHNERAHR
jgi:ubiquinone/menaquinone biosynthesis C-methylase UbiE